MIASSYDGYRHGRGFFFAYGPFEGPEFGVFAGENPCPRPIASHSQPASRSLVAGVTATASAQDWAEKMFKEKTHEFGSVPKAAKVEYAFEMVNPYKEDVHISGVRASCGCTIPRIQKETLASWEKGAIIAEFNTRAFSGQRGARVTVTIDKPFYAEVQLQVHGYIRTDVVVDPGEVALGQVPSGSGRKDRDNRLRRP